MPLQQAIGLKSLGDSGFGIFSNKHKLVAFICRKNLPEANKSEITTVKSSSIICHEALKKPAEKPSGQGAFSLSIEKSASLTLLACIGAIRTCCCSTDSVGP